MKFQEFSLFKVASGEVQVGKVKFLTIVDGAGAKLSLRLPLALSLERTVSKEDSSKEFSLSREPLENLSKS